MASIPSNGYAEVMSGTNNYSGSNSYDGSCPRTAIAPVSGNDLCNKTYVDAGGLSVTDTNTNATYYPTFVAGSGLQPLLADIATGPFSINPNNGNFNVSDTIKINQTQVAIGKGAATTNQATSSVAIGTSAGQLNQPVNSVAIGLNAGLNGAGGAAYGYNVAIGAEAGRGVSAVQGAASVAIGAFAGQNSNHLRSIIINGTGVALDNPATPDALFIKPIRGVPLGVGVGRMYYAPVTGEVTYSTT